MGTIHIHGGIPLQGQVRIQGSKNAALPILAGTVLTEGSCLLKNCPKIADVFQMQTLLVSLGCSVRWEGEYIRVHADRVCPTEMPREAVTGMRSSITLLGALLGRCGRAAMEHPGGCVIGKRPIDLHIHSLEQMNVKFSQKDRVLYAYTEELRGAQIELACPSVGATENIVLAGVLAKGHTEVRGAAREPEVTALCRFLKSCGACISGEGTDHIFIDGVEKLHGAEFTVPSDRIVAGTYLMACLSAGGGVLLEDAPVKDMEATMEVARSMGACLQETAQGLYVQAPAEISPIAYLQTEGYPGFPTDMQSLVLAVLPGATGDSVVEENIFENRFRIVPELVRMGAAIRVEDGRRVYVQGKTKLHGTDVKAEELRGGAALVVAGMGAFGETVIDGKTYIDRDM